MRCFMKFPLILTIVLLIFCTSSESATSAQVIPGVPVKNTVTLVDLGAKSCIPCKLMAPILVELEEEYKGRAAVIFIDVWDKANAGKAKAFRIMAIPTQIFFDKQGKEVYRHLGFLGKDDIVIKLEELLAK